MLDKITDHIKERSIKSAMEEYRKIADSINNIDYQKLDNTDLLRRSVSLRKKANNGVSLKELLIEAYGLVKETVIRTLRLEAFDEQLMAAAAMNESRIVEMQTGEGKTLTAVFTAYLNSLTGKGVHILTFNDYLARRDASWMGPVYKRLGLEVGYIQEGMNKEERRNAYNCDITYVTAKEAGFDYLRDFMCHRKEDMVHREFNFAIIDEADSILIDEARVPLVIAASTKETSTDLIRVADAVRRIIPEDDYKMDEYLRNVYLTEQGISKVEKILGCDNLYAPENFELLNEVNSALHAEILLKRDVDYIVRSGKIEMIDEFTGRVAENRHWPDALQAALETKEGLTLQSKGRIMSQITLQGLVLMYKKLAGMTGTASNSAEEIKDFYELDVLVIPPHKPCIRMDHPDLVFTHKEAKFKALVKEIAKVHFTGQPILIGTNSVMESAYLAAELEKSGVKCQVLNAKNDELEAAVIEQAGSLGAVTVSTNMAGRGTDIKLGGSKELQRDKVVELGGLYVIGTNRHESRRIDKQLRGRAGRQGDPGETRFFISLEDDLLQKYGIERIMPEAIRPQKQDESIESNKLLRKINQVQRIMEGQNSDIRRELWKYSIILENQRLQIHERRIEIISGDDQCRFLQEKAPDLFEKISEKLTEEELTILEKHIMLYHMDEGWAEHLLRVAIIREGIHLNAIGGKVPVEVFRIEVARAFTELSAEVEERIIGEFSKLQLSKESMKNIENRLKTPSSTWTYLVNDNTFNETIGMMVLGSGAKGNAVAAVNAIVAIPAILIAAVMKTLIKKNKEEKKEQ